MLRTLSGRDTSRRDRTALMFHRSCGLGLAIVSVSTSAAALPNGIATGSCSGCHTAEVAYDGTLTLEAAGPLSPGVKTEFTLRIEESHMKAAGFFVTSDGVGTFSAGTGNKVLSGGIAHSKPFTATDGVAEVKFSWTPPTEPDGLDMQVYVVAADNSSSQTGDIAVASTFSFVWGCEGLTLYTDIDADGYGDEDGPTSIGCGAREGWTPQGGDCNDLWASIHPEATEVSNNKDDNCDGEVDEGIEVKTWYYDADSDGYGYGTGVTGETAPADYVDNNADCDDDDPTISPDGKEVCDGRDNDCNRKLDDGDGVFITCGLGLCARVWETCDTQCVPGTPMTEICDGLDDDCDGSVDEDVTCPDGSLCTNGTCPTSPATSGSSGPSGAPPTASDSDTASAMTSGDPASSSTPASAGTDAGGGAPPVAPEAGAAESEDLATDDTPDENGGGDDEEEDDATAPAPSNDGGCAVSPRGAKALWLLGALAVLSLRRRRTRG